MSKRKSAAAGKATVSANDGSQKKLRVAFIGAGGIAGMHMDILAQMTDVELVGLADVSESNMAKHSQKFKIPASACFTDWKKMLARIKPDAVSVCTPNGLHAPASIDASNAGADVIVEKPMAMNAKEAQAMINAAKKNRKKLVIGFQYRYSPKTTYIKNAVEEGQFGKILYGRVWALRRRGIPNWGVFGRKDLQGGGPMIDIGVHALEMAHFAMGSPRPVSAVGSTFTYMGNKKEATKIKCGWPNWDYKTYTVEDLAVGHIHFENGAALSIEASFAAHLEKDEFNFWIMGEKAGARWEPAMIYTDAHGHMVNQAPAYVGTDDFTVNFRSKMRNWVDHCLYDKPTMAPAEHGLMVQKMLDGVYRSAENGGREVKIS
ncbi:MAG: Gfo/Idh/MocA family oxidoreductase [Phycisphaeraceae bacterium]|nr:Gfo/Idh/MocA family oxidoreductase [Phycisphaeraceae bacterium]